MRWTNTSTSNFSGGVISSSHCTAVQREPKASVSHSPSQSRAADGSRTCIVGLFSLIVCHSSSLDCLSHATDSILDYWDQVLLSHGFLPSHASLPAQDEWFQKSRVVTDCMCASKDGISIINRQLEKLLVLGQSFPEKLSIRCARDNTASHRPRVFGGPF